MLIVSMDYEDIGLVCVRTTRNGKIRNNYIRYIVDEYSIDKAIRNTKSNNKFAKKRFLRRIIFTWW